MQKESNDYNEAFILIEIIILIFILFELFVVQKVQKDLEVH